MPPLFHPRESKDRLWPDSTRAWGGLLWLSLLLSPLGAWAQPATTTLTVPMYTAAGGKFTGTITVSWPSFTSADSFAVSAGSKTLQVTNGILSGTLVPTDALSGASANARYTARYGVTAGQPLSPPLTETWNVPTSGPVTSLNQLRAVTPPPYTPTGISGGSSLTTVGAIPYVSASATLNQDPSGIFWASATNRLGLGTQTPAYTLDLADGQARFFTASGFSGGKGGVLTTANNARGGLQMLNASATPVAEFVEDPAYGWRLNTAENIALNFGVNSTTYGGFTTAGIFQMGFGSTPDAVMRIRLGSAQLGSGESPFEIRRTNGTSQLAGIDNAGGFYTSNGTTRLFVMGVTAASLAANMPINWSNTANDVDQTRDLGISRCAAGILCVGNGTQDNKSGRIALDNTTPSAASDACTAQSIWADANYVYVCTASGAIKRAAIVTWP